MEGYRVQHKLAGGVASQVEECPTMDAVLAASTKWLRRNVGPNNETTPFDPQYTMYTLVTNTPQRMTLLESL